jgi:peptidoglycan hydrolase-like protein with peptidoglycan-binding domain
MTDYPTYSARRASLASITSWSTFTGMHPKMQERVSALIEASGGKVGLGQGLRPPAQQLQLFLSRHVPDTSGPYTYDGQRWRRLPNMAAAVPPGRSMHEIGLAADLVGDLSWVGEHAARFHLQTFANVNREPWHVQPVELPRGRSEYKKSPAWGLPPWDGSAPTSDSSTSTGSITSTSTDTKPMSLTPALRARPGDTGPAVAVMIEALIAHGLLPDVSASRDGAYGPDDRKVVEQFQRTAGLTIDGIVGPQTWGELLRVVKPGAEGPHVRVVQVTLINRGLLRDTAGNHDGKYGPATQTVVRRFQTAAGLKPDGEVGPATWTALIGDKRRVQVRTRAIEPEGDDFDFEDIDILAVLDGLPGE